MVWREKFISHINYWDTIYGGYIDKGEGTGGWKPAEGDDRVTKSNELIDVFNKKLVSMDIEPISSLNGHVAVCNVFQTVNVDDIPLNINPEDYKCDQRFGDTTSGQETPDVILSKIINNSKWIHAKLIEGKHVFVHCNAGASRSPTVVVKMLIDTLGVSIYRAIQIVKQHAPKMSGNDRVNIINFEHLLKEVGARAVVDLEPEPDMSGFGAVQATQQDSKEDEISKIIEKIGQKNLTIETFEREGIDITSRRAEQREEYIDTLSYMFPGIDRGVVNSALDISGGNFDSAVQIIKGHQHARGGRGGGEKIKKRRKSNRRKTKSGKINKTKKSKGRYKK